MSFCATCCSSAGARRRCLPKETAFLSAERRLTQVLSQDLNLLCKGVFCCCCCCRTVATVTSSERRHFYHAAERFDLSIFFFVFFCLGHAAVRTIDTAAACQSTGDVQKHFPHTRKCTHAHTRVHPPVLDPAPSFFFSPPSLHLTLVTPPPVLPCNPSTSPSPSEA